MAAMAGLWYWGIGNEAVPMLDPMKHKALESSQLACPKPKNEQTSSWNLFLLFFPFRLVLFFFLPKFTLKFIRLIPTKLDVITSEAITEGVEMGEAGKSPFSMTLAHLPAEDLAPKEALVS